MGAFGGAEAKNLGGGLGGPPYDRSSVSHTLPQNPRFPSVYRHIPSVGCLRPCRWLRFHPWRQFRALPTPHSVSHAKSPSQHSPSAYSQRENVSRGFFRSQQKTKDSVHSRALRGGAITPLAGCGTCGARELSAHSQLLEPYARARAIDIGVLSSKEAQTCPPYAVGPYMMAKLRFSWCFPLQSRPRRARCCLSPGDRCPLLPGA